MAAAAQEVPSYLRGYEKLYARDPRAAATEWFREARFGLFLQQLQVMQRAPSEQPYGFSLWFGTALIAVGVIVNVFAGWHHLRLVRELDLGETVRSRSLVQAVAIAFFLALVGLAMAIYLVSVRSSIRW